MQVGSLAVGAEDGDQLDRPVDRPEPVRSCGCELHRLARLDREVLVAEAQPQVAVEHVHPIVPVVRSERCRRAVATGMHMDLVRLDSSRRTAIGERPERQPVVCAGSAADAWVGRRGGAEQFVGAHSECGGERGEVVESEAALAGLEPAQRGHVDGGPFGDLLE